MAATLKRDVREAILVAAREAAMAYGYGGINFRDLAEAVGIKAASINYYFATRLSSARRLHALLGRYCTRS